MTNKKTSLSEDSSNIWCDVFVLSKIAYLEGFFGFGVKSMSLFSPFLFSKNLNYPPKILILTNVKTSPPQENVNIDDDVFVLIKKKYLKCVFGYGSIGFFVRCYYTFSNKIPTFLTPLNAF